MKNLLIPLLAVSLTANAVLAVFLSRQSAGATSRPSEQTTSAATAGPAGPTAAGAPTEARAAADRAGGPAASAPVTWAAAYSGGDLSRLVASLRAAGFPPAALRAVVNQMLNERFADRLAALSPPFWKRYGLTPDQIAAQQALQEEQRALFEQLLGEDGRPSAVLGPVVREARYGNIPDAKIDALVKIERDYGEVQRLALAQRKANAISGYEEQIQQREVFEREYREDLAAVLTPAELEEFEKRSSPGASRLMNQLRAIDVSEAEYTALFRMQQLSDATNPARYGATNADMASVRLSAQDALNEQVRTVLTDDRFYKYLEAADTNYARTAQFAAVYPALTPANAYELSRYEKQMQGSFYALARDASLSASDRSAAQSKIRQEYEAKLHSLLGAELGALYQQFYRSGKVPPPANAARPPGG